MTLIDVIRRTLRVVLIAPLLLLVLGAGSAQAAITPLYNNIEGPRTVSGIDSHAVGRSDDRSYRTAMAFKPTKSGTAQLLSMRGRCVVPYPTGTACANIGQVSLYDDAGGKPAGAPLGTMGFYLLEDTQGSWRIKINGNPTGGTFRLTVTADGVTRTTAPIAFDATHDGRGLDTSVYWRLHQINFQPGFMTHGRFPEDPLFLRFEGTITVTDVQLTGGKNPSVDVTQPRIEEECGTLSPAPQLKAGHKYWAVMTAEDGVGWDDWSNDTGEVLESVDGGTWDTAFSTKVPTLRIDSGSNTCQPVAEPNPVSGTSLGQMIVRPGGAPAWTTITMSNRGIAPMTLGGATFSGKGKAFSLMDGSPGPLARNAALKPIGIDGTSIFYPTCNTNVPEGWYRSSLDIETSDPDQPVVRYPISCLVDGTPPRIDFRELVPGGNGWVTTTGTKRVKASDPESDDMIESLSCSRGSEQFSTSGKSLDVKFTEEGDAPIKCTVRDVAGNSATVSQPVKIDTRRPSISSKTSPEPNADGWSNAAQVAVSFECSDPVPGSGVAAGPDPQRTLTAETSGTNVDSGECRDAAGLQADRVGVRVKIDRTTPAIAASVSPAPNAAGWNRTDATVAFACADRGPVQAGIGIDTAADVVVTDETAGRTVTSNGRCVDRAGNEASAGSRTVKVDKTEPSTALESGPSGGSRSGTAQLAFSGSDALSGVARFECSLDGAAFAACTSPRRLDNLADGDHAFRVRAVDVAGNVDGTPETRVWTVDAAAPSTRIDSGPANVTGSRAATFTYAGDAGAGGPVTSYECRLDDAAFAPCASDGTSYSGLAGGTHRFEVRARDGAGRVDPAPAARDWTVDLVAPSTTIAGAPDASTPATDAAFSFTAADAGGSEVAGFECRLDGAPFAACSSPVALADLAPGPHTFAVRAADAVGNVEGTPASYSWTIAATESR